MSNPSITADKTPWYQWDTGITVTVSGFAMTECHFANRKQGTAYVQAVINGVARVPDELLQVAAPIKAYGYVSDGAGGQTYVEQSFDVIARNIPADYTYTKTAQKTIRDAEQARDQAVQAAKYAKASELAADDSAVEASNSAQSAGESASAAATSASNAAKSAGDAAKSASDAKAAADKAVEDASDLLKTYTDNAKTSADNAATSARNAADAASSASGSASAAAQSATDASNAKVAAQTAKAEAATSASNAATSASNAESSATAAAKSASDAAASVNAINVIAPLHTATSATADNTALAIGNGSHSYGSYSIAIGASSDCGNDSSVAMGDSARTTRDAEFSIGSISGGRYLANVKSPELDTDATNKKYTDDNDTKTLSEAKKYTDANTSNSLTGTVSGKLLHVEDAWPSQLLGVTIEGAYKQDGTPSPENPVPITVIENPVLKITGADTSSAGTSTPFTLPAEHPYLAKLPDGTHDEIVIDKDGNASLVARVQKVDVSNLPAPSSSEALDNGLTRYQYWSVIDPSARNDSVAVAPAFKSVVNFAFPQQGMCASNVIIIVGASTDPTDALKAGGYIYTTLATPVTYPLGKLDIPALPETISNVWTDAELTTDMSMTYKRDINIAYDNLVQAVVAAAAGE